MRRVGVILLLIFQTVFLNIVVPGHLRGVVTLVGKSSAKGIGDLVCGGCCQKQNTNNPEKPTRKDRENCAICFFAAHLTTPPVIDFSITDLGPLKFIEVATVQTIEPITFVHTYDACGPPIPA